jgi:signal transduction histidine kinase
MAATSQPGSSEQLSSWLRATAARAAEMVGGGCSLLFAAAPGESGVEAAERLRAAAGFDSPESARRAAAGLLDPVQQAIRNCEANSATMPDGGTLATAEVSILPLSWDGRVHGALAVACPSQPDSGTVQNLAQLAGDTGLRLDHMQLSTELEKASKQQTGAPGSGEDQSDELLKLSEALFAQDIELLRNTEKLGKIEKLKNDFIEKMSRELRTPLNNIIEAIISVIAGENERLSEQAVASLRTALDEGTAFQRTLQNILDLWRIKQGELPIEIQEVNFAEVVEEAIFSVQETLGDKPVTIRKELEGALPKLKTDLTKTNQILFLLLDNAAKYTESGHITISAHLANDKLTCAVSDTGIGICPDDQQLIFDEFFQVDDLSSTRYRGAGLGLTLVRDLLVLLDGEIQVQSEAGRGTSISFQIPVQEA